MTRVSRECNWQMRQEVRFHACPFRPRLPVYLAALAAVLLAAYPLSAQFMVLPVNLTYLAQRAGIIVQGRVTEVRYESLPGHSNIPTVEVTLPGVIQDLLIEKFTLPSTGTCYIRVSDLRGDGRPDFIYESHLSGAK